MHKDVQSGLVATRKGKSNGKENEKEKEVSKRWT